MDRLLQIREAEKNSHVNIYSKHALYAPGSWLSKSVGTVLELFPLFSNYDSLRVLDLGCGVGRNSIAAAKAFENIPCNIDCVDILPTAIQKLEENADYYHTGSIIHGILSTIEGFLIERDYYDLILAVSALEHVDSLLSFHEKLGQISAGLHPGGVACLIVNTEVTECRKSDGINFAPQFEVLLRTEDLINTLHTFFSGWELIKQSIVHQKYDVPREYGTVEMNTNVVTYVVRKRL